MNKDKYVTYGIALVAVAVIAVWAGLPPVALLLLACPVMMFFMMSGTHGGRDADAKPRTAEPDGSHERIDQP